MREELPPQASPSDEELALALQKGDVEAYEELVRRHQGRVYALAYRMTGNREDALDVSQEALLKAYRKVHKWRPTGGFLPWLLRLTANQAIDFIRRRKRRQAERPGEDYELDGVGMTDTWVSVDTERELRAREIDERVRGALEVLSPAQRTVFVLRHYEGLQLADIAEALGCTVGSVKVHLFRALNKLRKELADMQQ